MERCSEILGKPVEELFTIKPAQMEMPQKARIDPSKPCSRCGESTMGAKLENVDGEKVCRGCLATQ